MKILFRLLVHAVKKIVRRLLQGKVSLPGRYGKWIEGYAGIRKKPLTFLGGGYKKLVSEVEKSSRKEVIVFKA